MWEYFAHDKVKSCIKVVVGIKRKKNTNILPEVCVVKFLFEIFDELISRKIKADMYIDDLNYGGLSDWGEIYAGIQGGEKKKSQLRKKKGFRLFG